MTGFSVEKVHGRTFAYHYTRMDGMCQKIYRKIYNALDLHLDALLLEQIFETDTVKSIYCMVLNDNPTLFWVSKSLTYTERIDGILLDFSYNYTKQETTKLMEEITASVDHIYDKVASKCKSEYELSLAVHDYLTANVKYVDDDDRCRHNIVGPLVYRSSVCEGIAAAYSYLLNVFGMRCTTVSGNVEGSPIGHSWNIVRIDGEPYHVDVTHDLEDTTYHGNHRCLNVNDEYFLPTRIWKTDIKCNEMKYNYFEQNGTVFSNKQQLKSYFKKGLENGAHEFEFVIRPTLDRNVMCQKICNYLQELGFAGRMNFCGQDDVFYVSMGPQILRSIKKLFG